LIVIVCTPFTELVSANGTPDWTVVDSAAGVSESDDDGDSAQRDAAVLVTQLSDMLDESRNANREEVRDTLFVRVCMHAHSARAD
jgi:hypothetical protein